MRFPRRSLFVFAACAFIPPARSSFAQSIFDVSNNLDNISVSSSLPAAISAANVVAGSTVAWTSTAGGVIDLTPSDLPTIGGNTSLDVTGSSAPVTISGGSANAVTLNGGVTFINNSSQLWTISSSIADGTSPGSLIKSGFGSLSLAGANSYSGGTMLDEGILNISTTNAAALGSGVLTLNGGTLQAGTTVTVTNNISMAASSTIDAAGNPFTISGIISGSSGTVASPIVLSYTNSGVNIATITVTGANTYLGNTNLNSGIINITNNGDGITSGAFGAATSMVTLNGGTLQAGANNLNVTNYLFVNNNTFGIDTNGYSTMTLSGVISGTGLLVVTSTGSVSITNPLNSFTAGINITNGATVVISSDAALGNGGSIGFNLGTLQIGSGSWDPGSVSTRNIGLSTGGGTIDTNGNNPIYSGLVFGGGSLTKVGVGTLYLTDSNSYSGGTFLNQGTINIVNGGGLGSGVLTMNGGILQTNGTFAVTIPITLAQNQYGYFDTQGSTTTFSGVVTGGGTFVANSTGTIVLNNNNTYSGGTIINSGILNIESDPALGTSTGTVTLNGGTLQLGLEVGVRNMTTPRSFFITSAGGTFDTDTFNLALTGVIASGVFGSTIPFVGACATCSLTKTGTGILTLSGANTYGGSTTIDEDTLQLGANDTLPSGTPLTVNSNATFDMGINPTTGASYSQTIGSYAGAGNLKVTFAQSGQPALLNVTNNADVTNGTLVVGLAPGILANGDIKGKTFNVMQYGTFTGSGMFPNGNIVSPALINFTQSVAGGNTLQLTAGLVPFAKVPGINANEAAVGSSLESLRTNPTGDIATVLGNLYTLDATGVGQALDQIGPLSLAAMSGVGMADSSVESAAVSQRMGVLARGGGSGISNFQVSGRSDVPGTLIASADQDVAALLAENGGVGSPWGAFVSPTATTGRLLEANSPSGTQPGYAFNSGGLTGGADYRFNDNFAGGVALGYLHGHASIYAPASGTVDNNSFRFGFYGTSFTDKARANLYVGGAADAFSTSRGIIIPPAISRTATASPGGTELNMDSNASYDFQTLTWGTFSPFAGLAYDRLMIGGFSESGADSLDLNVSPETAQSLRSSLGLRYSEKFKLDDWSTTPYTSLGWRHEFIDQSRAIQAQLASGTGNVFSVNTGNYARDGVLIGGGVQGNVGDQWSGKVDWQGDFRARFMDNTFTATLRYKF